MEQKIVTKEEIKIIGIEIWTTNENGRAMKDIPALWKRFFAENIKEKISNKVDREVYGLYIEYEKDFTKPYAFVIGCKVNNLDSIPEDMIGKTIPAAKYAVFKVKGKFPERIPQAWQEIWNLNLERTYTGDFEVYDKRFENKESPEIDIYIAVK